MGITQPTLSHQIKALEDELGVPLFDRIGKKIAITEAGMILYKECNKVFSNLSSAREQIQELQQIERGTLTIGALPGELNQLVSTLLVDFHRKYPKVRINIFQLIDRTCTSAGFDLQPLIENTTIDSLFGLLRSGAGATILSKTLIEMYKSDDLQVIPVENQ